jgi:hypothetical protein
MKNIRFILFALALLLAAAAPALAQAGGHLKVTVLMFSGQLNPSYTIDKAEDIAGIRALFQVSAAKGGDPSNKFVPKLGYNGLLVENVGNVEGLPGRFYVSKGNIYLPPGTKSGARSSGTLQSMGAAQSGSLPDENRSLEKTLYDAGAAEGKISPKMKDVIK